MPKGNRSTDLRSLIRERGFFANVTDQAIESLLQQMRPRFYHPGELLFKEGDPATWTFMVVTGEVEVVKTARSGVMIQVNVLQPGQWGGITGLTGQQRRMARLLSRGEVEILSIDHSELIALLDDVPALAAGFLACMGGRIHDDNIHLAASLESARAVGLDAISADCTPLERLMLDTIRHRVAAAESLHEIMDYVFDSVLQVSVCDRLTLAFIDEGGTCADCHWSRATYEPLVLLPCYREDLADSVMEAAGKLSMPVVVNDLEQFSIDHPLNQATHKRLQEGLQACLVSPLLVSGLTIGGLTTVGRTIGFLICSSKKKETFNTHQMHIHQAIADNISPVVEKAFRIEQLIQANNDYQEVLAFVNHELQSPIASMVTDARLMAAEYLGALNEKQHHKLQRSIHKGEYLLTLIQDYLNLARLEDLSLRARIQPRVNVLAQVLEPEVELIESQLDAKKMTVQWVDQEGMPEVPCDVGLLRIAVSNLLRNAVKYGREGGIIRIQTALANESISIIVWNQGPGFSKSGRQDLFHKFSRLDDPDLKKEKGTGIGLYSTWRIMQMHRGHVRARSEQGEWAEFTLLLPLRQLVS
jgi:signal transduction histidine kinase/CRP-like cAMP-binding protein